MQQQESTIAASQVCQRSNMLVTYVNNNEHATTNTQLLAISLSKLHNNSNYVYTFIVGVTTTTERDSQLCWMTGVLVTT